MIIVLPANNTEGLGGKAANLSRLLSAGFNVPAAFVIPEACYFEHVKRSGISGDVTQYLSCEGDEKQKALERIRKKIISVPLEENLMREIEAAFKGAEGSVVAVRSSAAGEDSKEYSFAGQYDSFLGISLKECGEAVKKCWASLWSRHAVEYRMNNGIGISRFGMAVLVQEMVNSDAAGACFTVNPATKADDEIIIEAVKGFGDKLVSGTVSPDSFTVSKKDRKLVKEYYAAGRGGSIDGKTALLLSKAALEIEALFGAPVDIEWAIEKGNIFFLQARPVTAGADSTVWANFNTGELVPDPVKTLSYDFISKCIPILFSPMKSVLNMENCLGLIGGRVYFNATFANSLVKQVPGMKRKGFAEFFGGDGVEVDEALLKAGAPYIQSSKVSGFGLLLKSPGFAWKALLNINVPMARTLNTDVDKRRYTQLPDYAHMSDSELINRINVFFDAMTLGADRYLWGMFMGIGYLKALTDITKKWLGDDTGALTGKLLSGLGEVWSAEPGLELSRLGLLAANPKISLIIEKSTHFLEAERMLSATEEGTEFLKRFKEFMEAHGHHARAEIDISLSRWSEDPDLILGMIKHYAFSGGKALSQRYEELAAGRKSLITETMGRLSFIKRGVFRFILKRAERGVMARENLKSEIIRDVFSIRRDCLECGRRLHSRKIIKVSEDVFFLDFDEIFTCLHGNAEPDILPLIEHRRKAYIFNCSVTPPPVVIGKFDPKKHIEENRSYEVKGSLAGTAVSAGVVTGKARVILMADAGEKVLPGEILVAPFTDPGWSIYFVTAAGLVVDMGGVLSHGSVVAREYGLPAVVNVKNATKIIKTGQTIRVDGNKGTVEIIK